MVLVVAMSEALWPSYTRCVKHPNYVICFSTIIVNNSCFNILQHVAGFRVPHNKVEFSTTPIHTRKHDIPLFCNTGSRVLAIYGTGITLIVMFASLCLR